MAGLLDFVLPAIFSAGDSVKRQIKGLLGDPAGTVKQFINNKNDEAAAHLADIKQSTQGRMAGLLGEQVTPEQLAADQRVNQALANGYNPAGMIVWHGSPHNFTKFDASKIGTGEGAQAYGHGLYLAESPDVAIHYKPTMQTFRGGEKNRFSIDGKIVEMPLEDANAQSALMSLARGDRKTAERMLQTWKDSADVKRSMGFSTSLFDGDIELLERALAAKNVGIDSGFLYKVDLPDSAIAKMLDWDKPLSQQAPEVQKALADEAQKYINRRAEVPDAGMIVRAMQPPERFGGSAAVSEMLRQQGIPGIRYLDGGSRAAGQGTANYVIFPGNEGLLTILERNGVPLR